MAFIVSVVGGQRGQGAERNDESQPSRCLPCFPKAELTPYYCFCSLDCPEFYLLNKERTGLLLGFY